MIVHRILLSGGTGSRMGAEEPKQFLPLRGKPVLQHSAATLQHWKVPGRFVCVAPPEHMERTRSLLDPGWLLAPGGSNRHLSTLCGIDTLGTVDPDDLIFIHDAARPLITLAEIDRLACAMMETACLIGSLVSPVHDTIIRTKQDGRLAGGIVPRDELRSVKTPQALRARALTELRRFTAEFTDLLSWAAAAGLDAILVDSDPANLKMTTASDLRVLEALAGF